MGRPSPDTTSGDRLMLGGVYDVLMTGRGTRRADGAYKIR